ncbi:hypothetical protein [Leptospira santarosai]|uniref:Uncharacterized protein n=1 Tax=Leptospira santarosai serovar Arenal str. MAVJ 401 TaxID=1049976 RepID=M6JVI8_9LEPT|nr:hypothetical protein [Leptospira santarosai]EMM77883.1 hypothetical protein LEP1GSC040_3988 [Leptospira santarosai str. 2000030832]EMN23563.1 hypothetical protein LEP1GSC063_4292 [Leptospira santarosai serovar Arenal str. MAVJ 401]
MSDGSEGETSPQCHGHFSLEYLSPEFRPPPTTEIRSFFRTPEKD